jgi:hypothetical protein
MSVSGQTRKSSMRANVFRFAPCQYRKSGVTKLPERHLVPSTLIRQNGCPNYMKFRMTLKPNPKSRFIPANKGDAPWPTTNR